MQEQTIFIEALELADPTERVAFLERACGADLALRERIDKLLQRHQQDDSFLKGPAIVPNATGECTPGLAGKPAVTGSVQRPGTVIGPYKLLQQIGEGGMGTVFMAEQTEPVQRTVALKIIKPGMDSRQVIARFEAERQALALMDHPNIARVLDAGTTETGRPYFVMELVTGVPITRFCDERCLPPKERLELFIQVCQGVQHAHQKGIIHRDLKPSNVLIALYDDKPVPKVIDFGIAKATGQKLTERTMFTEFGQIVGTLEYMSPEQAGLNQLDIDTRSDIYSLGVLLYELLTGSTPLEKKRLKEAAMLEVLQLIREEEPPEPSMRLSATDEIPSVAANRGLEPKSLSGLVRGDLDWIVMKALEKDRNRRFETANGFAQDIRRYLANEPVQACPPSAWYRVHKFTRRHKGGVLAAAAALVVLLLAGSGVGWVWWDRAGRLAKTDRTVSVALARSEQLADQAEARQPATSQEAGAVLVAWGQADAALAEAESAEHTGATDEALRRRIEDVRRRLERGRRQVEQRRTLALRQEKFLRDLDEARLRRATWIGNSFDYAGAAAKYQGAFAAFGLTVEAGRIAELVQRIRAEAPEIREALLVALHDWAAVAAQALTKPTAAEMRDLAEAADDDGWRRRYRVAAAAGNRAALRDLSVAARTLSLPATSLDLLAQSLAATDERQEALTLLRWARGRHPTDFFVHYQLGVLLNNSHDSRCSPLDRAEAISCYRAALALRPEASAVHNDLGIALTDAKQWDDALAELQWAIDLDPNLARAYTNRAAALVGKGQLDQATESNRQAIHLDPNDPSAHHNLGLTLCEQQQWDAAIVEFKTAIALDANYVKIYINLGNALDAKGQLDDAIAEYKKAMARGPKSALSYYNLGRVLKKKQQWQDAIAELEKAIALDPQEPDAHGLLALAYENTQRWDEAIAEHKKVIELDSKNLIAHNNLGLLLSDRNRLPEAVALLNRAIQIDPECARAYANLGKTLALQNRLPEAITAHEKSLRIDPRNAKTLNNYAGVLASQKKLDEAVAAYRRALLIDPQCAVAQNGLGAILYDQNKLEEAIATFRKAIELDPKDAAPHFNLGLALAARREWDDSVAEYRKGFEIEPNDVPARYDFAKQRHFQQQLPEAVAGFRTVLRLNPTHALAYYGLGNALRDQGDTPGARNAFETAIRLAPGLAEAHCNLGHLLRDLGEFRTALAHLRRGHELGSKQPGWQTRYPSAQWVAWCQRLVELDERLPAVLAGKTAPPSAEERIELAGLCSIKRLHWAAVTFYEEAFVAQPGLQAANRYQAARAAALAGCGQGQDGGRIDQRDQLRTKALDWLRDDLTQRTKQLEQNPVALGQTLRQWQGDAGLAGVRTPDSLARLPKAEQEAWQQLWADVATTLERVRKTRAPESKPE